MFGQQPQYNGYNGYGQPQPMQQYGQPMPQPQQSRMSASQMLDQIESQSSKGAKFERPGDRISGIIEKVTANQVRDFNTKQPAFWQDGSPKLQVLVTINTGVTDPNVEDDDGYRTVYIKGWGEQRRAWLDAIRRAGLHKASDIKPGDRFTAVFTGYGQSSNGMQPPKVMEYTIEHQSPADMAMNQPQPAQPAMQQPAQQWFVDPWSGQPMQPAQPASAPQPVTIPTQQPQPSQPRVDAQQILQLKALGKPPQEIAGMLGLSVEQVTAVTDQANPGMHGGEDASEAF